MTEKEFRIGELIENRYRVLGVIGKGGMGMLYRVADEAQADEIVALKMVRMEGAGEIPGQVEHFQREFRLLTQLRHPNLVSVYDYGITTTGRLYFTMEWIEGRDLEPNGRRMDIETSVPIVVQVCRALAYLHSRGVIHGDLKPANVLLLADATANATIDDQVKIVDFGIALEMRSPEARTRYYSAGYSAPEMKKPRPIDHRADLYSLGALWYALLVGEAPLFIMGPEMMIRFALREALEGRDLADVSDVIVRLLATAPEKRYANANEIVEAINRIAGSAYELETRETAESYALRVPFVNREAEIEVLRTIWQQARDGQGQVVLISGEGGVGKTRLVRELEIQAEMEGARVVWGQCVERGGSAYQSWREVLRVLVRYVEWADKGAMQQIGPVLAALLPELWEREYMAGLPPPVEIEAQAAQLRLNNAIVSVMRAAASLRPTVIVVENVQWADEATLEMICFLARISVPRGLLVCVTYRSDEINAENRLLSLSGDQVQRVPLQPLSSEVTANLVRSMLGLEQAPPPLMERVQQTTGGNAFFVQELIRSLAAGGKVLRRTVEGWQVDGQALQEAQLPESIRQVVERRLAQLSGQAREVLKWAAVVGVVFWEGNVAEVGQVARARVRAAASELSDLRLIAERDETAFAGEREYLFFNPVVREVSYESILPEERQDAHSRAAAWLLARDAREVDAHLGLIAEHLEQAGQMEQAVIYLQRAGEQAAERFANAEAIVYLNRALALVPEEDLTTHYELLLACETVYHLQGAREVQAEALDALNSLAQLRQRPGEQAEVALRQAKVAIATGDYSEAIASVQIAIAQAKVAGDVEQEAAAQLQWGEALRQQNEYDAASAHIASALVLVQVSGQRYLEADSLHLLGTVALNRGDYPAAQSYYEQSLMIAREIDYRKREGLVLGDIGAVIRSRGDYARGREYCEQSLAIAREMGHRQGEGWALLDIGLCIRSLGDHATARGYFEQALVLFHEIGDRKVEGLTFLNLGIIARSLGDYAGAQIYFEQSLLIFREIDDRMRESLTLHDLGIIASSQGDYARARGLCERALTLAREIGHRRSESYALMVLGNALVGLVNPGEGIATLRQIVTERELERLADAADVYRQALDIRRELGALSLAMGSLAGLARVALMQGNLTLAQTRIEEILGYLQNNALYGVDEPFRVYLTCYCVLRANQDDRARIILNTAYRLLQERAAKISDEDMRCSFLENVAAHREIVREFADQMEAHQ